MIDDEKSLFFQHRWDSPLRDNVNVRDDLIELIDELLELEAQTHPSAGDCTDKDELSRRASMVAGVLLQEVFGWAVDHQIGLVINGLPGGAPSLFEDVDVKVQQQANSHVHEATAFRYVFLDDDLQIDRKMLRSLLNALPPSLLPAKLLAQVLPALDSLEVGEQPDFFARNARTHGQERSPYRKWMVRLKAVEHLEFLRGMNVKREDAKGSVADAYGIEPDTLDTWSTKLSRELKGIIHVATTKRCARNRGKVAIERLQKGDSSLVAKEAEILNHDGTTYQELSGTPDGKVVPIS